MFRHNSIKYIPQRGAKFLSQTDHFDQKKSPTHKVKRFIKHRYIIHMCRQKSNLVIFNTTHT